MTLTRRDRLDIVSTESAHRIDHSVNPLISFDNYCYAIRLVKELAPYT